MLCVDELAIMKLDFVLLFERKDVKINGGLNAELDGQAGIQQLAGDATMLYYTMEEAHEGGKAFLEKRKPDFDKYPYFP